MKYVATLVSSSPRKLRGLAVQGAIGVMIGGVAHAAASEGTSTLPFMSPLNTIETAVSGPFAYAMTVIGLVMAGVGLIFFGEMGKFVERLLYTVLVGSLILGGTQMISLISGAII